MDQLTVCLLIFAVTVIGYCSGTYSIATISQTSDCSDAYRMSECKAALGSYSNSNVIMIAGMCVVAGFNRTAFCARLAGRISHLAQGSVKKMMLGYVLIGVLLSQFIQSPVVVFGIVAPMLIASAESMGINPSKVIFPVGVATICTCCTLPLGAGATVAGELNGYIESYGYTHAWSGFDPMMGRLPMLIIAIIYFVFPCGFLRISPPPSLTSLAKPKTKNHTPLSSFSEIAAIVIFFGDAVALMFAKRLGLQNWEVCVAVYLF